MTLTTARVRRVTSREIAQAWAAEREDPEPLRLFRSERARRAWLKKRGTPPAPVAPNGPSGGGETVGEGGTGTASGPLCGSKLGEPVWQAREIAGGYK